MGYRLHPCEAVFPRKVSLGGSFTIETTWANAGMAPCYPGGFIGFAPATEPGTYDLYVSVGRRDATPIIALPYDNDDGHRCHRLGSMTVLPRGD